MKMLGLDPQVYLQQGLVIVQIWDVLQQASPDANIIESNTHPPSGQRVPHVVSIAQEEHACERQTAVCLTSKTQFPLTLSNSSN